jgi:predicted RNase H-like HicB family nuclease
MKRVWSRGPSRNLEPTVNITWRKPEGHLYRCRVFVFPVSDVKYTADCPMLPGMTGAGNTEVEAVNNIREALVAALKGYNERREKIPWVKANGKPPQGGYEKIIFVQV